MRGRGLRGGERGSSRRSVAGHAMQPFCAPLSRRMRVSLRVSMSAIATSLLRFRYVGEVFLVAPVGGHERQVADDEARGVDAARLGILGVGADVADVRIGERDDLAGVGGIGEDLLVAGHRGVEDHLADGLRPVDADRRSPRKTLPSARTRTAGVFCDTNGSGRVTAKTLGAKKRESAIPGGSSRFHWSKIIAEMYAEVEHRPPLTCRPPLGRPFA